jgi:hypothetical protein
MAKEEGVQKVAADLAKSVLLSVVIISLVVYAARAFNPGVTFDFTIFKTALAFVFLFVLSASYLVVKDWAKK